MCMYLGTRLQYCSTRATQYCIRSVHARYNFVVRIIEDSDNQGWYTEDSLYSNPHSSHSLSQPCTTTVPFLYTTPLAHVGSAYWSTTSRYSNSSSLSSLVSTGTSLPPPPPPSPPPSLSEGGCGVCVVGGVDLCQVSEVPLGCHGTSDSLPLPFQHKQLQYTLLLRCSTLA